MPTPCQAHPSCIAHAHACMQAHACKAGTLRSFARQVAHHCFVRGGLQLLPLWRLGGLCRVWTKPAQTGGVCSFAIGAPVCVCVCACVCMCVCVCVKLAQRQQGAVLNSKLRCGATSLVITTQHKESGSSCCVRVAWLTGTGSQHSYHTRSRSQDAAYVCARMLMCVCVCLCLHVCV